MSETLTEAERRQRKALLEIMMQDLDHADPYPQRPTERGTADPRKEAARWYRRELLTPLAACDLFEKSAPTVRRAAADKLVYSPFVLHVSGKPVRLIDLRSAIAYWSVEHSEHRLKEMRANGNLMVIDEREFNILHPEPLITRGDAEEEGEHRLGEMRAGSNLMVIDEREYDILHPEPLITRGDSEEEGEEK